MLSIRTIVHPTDFSETSTFAFRLACSLAADHGARLIVLHVIPEVSTPVGGVMNPPPSEDYPEVREQLDKIQPHHAGVKYERLLLVGEPAAEICRVAQENGAGLIVIGTHGRSGLRRLLMGSVAEEVLRKAHCPVLSVRVPLRIVQRQPAPAKRSVSMPAT